MFKEMFTEEMDGGNRGEINQAHQEKKESEIIRTMEAEYSKVATLMLQAATRVTGKRWNYGETKRYNRKDIYAMLVSNPGRLKRFKYTSDEDDRTPMLQAIADIIGSHVDKPVVEDGSLFFKMGGIKWEITYSGDKKADISVTTKEDMFKWAEKQFK